MKPDIERLLELQQLLIAFSEIERKVHRKQAGQFIAENDTEHSYNLAMTAWYLCRWFPELDKNLVIQYSLVHDFVEIHAGDTYIYGTAEELASKHDREAKALKQLESDWTDFGDMTEAIHAYEDRQNPESRFVYALDKIMPIMLIYLNEGYTWKVQDVTLEMLRHAKTDKVALSPEIMPYFEKLSELLASRPDLIK